MVENTPAPAAKPPSGGGRPTALEIVPSQTRILPMRASWCGTDPETGEDLWAAVHMGARLAADGTPEYERQPSLHTTTGSHAADSAAMGPSAEQPKPSTRASSTDGRSPGGATLRITFR